jgi:hypothetical protein
VLRAKLLSIIKRLVKGEISDKQCFTDKDSSRMAMYWPDVERSDWPMPPGIVRKQETLQRREDAHNEKTAVEQGRQQEQDLAEQTHGEYPATEDSGQQQQQEYQNKINDTNVIITQIE